jgi:phosphoserine phosphatase
VSRAATWRLADFPLAAFDTDSTPRIDCTGEVADAAGRKAHAAAAITEAAMRGEITDYKDMRPTGWHQCRR